MAERSQSPISRFDCLQCGKRLKPDDEDFCTGCEAEMEADAERGALDVTQSPLWRFLARLWLALLAGLLTVAMTLSMVLLVVDAVRDWPEHRDLVYTFGTVFGFVLVLFITGWATAYLNGPEESS